MPVCDEWRHTYGCGISHGMEQVSQKWDRKLRRRMAWCANGKLTRPVHGHHGVGHFPRPCTSLSLEVLNFSFVFLGRRKRCEGPKIPPLPGLGVLLPRVQPVLTRFEFPDHLSVRVNPAFASLAGSSSSPRPSPVESNHAPGSRCTWTRPRGDLPKETGAHAPTRRRWPCSARCPRT